MEKLAVTTTSLCRTYLGLQTSATWFDDADARLVDDLLLYIMQKGNMGRKVERGARSTRIVLHSFRNPVALVRYLYEGGRVHWAPAQVCVACAGCMLLPGGGNIRKGLARNVNVKELAGDMRGAQADLDLLERLGVTRM
ncbi:hypothetical protein [Slackia sp.]